MIGREISWPFTSIKLTNITNSQLGSFIRWKGNVNSSTPWADADLLPIVNISKDNITQAIVKENPNYFTTVSKTDTIAGQGDYQKPAGLLQFKRAEIAYSDPTSNPGAWVPLTDTSLDQMTYGESYYSQNQSTSSPLIRFDDTQFYVYPAPTTTTAGTAWLRLWYVGKRPDIADLTTSTDIETTTGIGSVFHDLIGDLVVNQIKYKKAEIDQEDLQDVKQHILEELVPGAFRRSTLSSSGLPPDNYLQH